MNLKTISIAVLAASSLFTGCKKDDAPTVEANSLEITVEENPVEGQIIGTVDFTANNTNNTRFSYSSNLTGLEEAAEINSIGEITVTKPSFFDFETRQLVSQEVLVEVFNSSDESASANFLITIHITDVLDSANGNGNGGQVKTPVQQRLNRGETPNDIYKSDNSLLDSLYGKTYLNALIFYFNTSTGKGMLAATSDQSDSLVWDFNTSGLKATGATETKIGKGQANTNLIVMELSSIGQYAANSCFTFSSNGYTDWFLPSLDELEQMYKKLHAKGIGNFQNKKYWSSSELSAGSAWFRDFSISNGQTAGTIGKYNTYAVRAFRNF